MLKRQKPPVHPGIILREDVIKEYGLTVTDAAKMLGVTRAALSDVLNGKAAISAEMAFRIIDCAPIIYLILSYHVGESKSALRSFKICLHDYQFFIRAF